MDEIAILVLNFLEALLSGSSYNVDSKGIDKIHETILEVMDEEE